MVFWIGIAVGLVFVYFAVRVGFYEIWAVLFNIVIAVYLGIYLSPVLAGIIGSDEEVPYNQGLMMLTVAVVTFVILEGITYVLFTSHFSISFPRFFNVVFSGGLGFLVGLLVWSFLVVLIYLTPVSRIDFVNSHGFGRQAEQFNVSYLCWWGNLVDRIVSADEKHSTKEFVAGLLADYEEKTRLKQVKPADPNDGKPKLNIFERLGPPPEIDVNDL
ncbi:MAG: CvpA family protein [Planctomycetota bacterium]|jgi:hypothetical protein